MLSYYESSGRDASAKNRWFRKCQVNQAPFVTITRRRKYSRVEWDYIALPALVDTQLDERGEFMLQELLAIFNRHANSKSHYQFSAGLGYMDNLFQDQARLAAEAVHDLMSVQLCDDL